MKIEEALRTDLLTVSALTALIASRIYPIDATISTTQTYPYVVYFPLGDRIGNTGEKRSYEELIQFSIHAQSYTQANAIADIIRERYETNRSISFTGGNIYNITYEGKNRATKDADSGYYTQPLTFRVSYLYA